MRLSSSPVIIIFVVKCLAQALDQARLAIARLVRPRDKQSIGTISRVHIVGMTVGDTARCGTANARADLREAARKDQIAP